jgi:DinB superfamily
MVLMATKKKQAKGRKKPTTNRSTSKAPAKTVAKLAARPKSPARTSFDKSLRDHVLFLLKGGGAHASFDDTLKDWPFEFAGIKVAKFPHTAWMLLEHIRLGQWDILEFSRNSKHVSPKWPEGYWPASAAPQSEDAWKASMAACEKDLRAMKRLVADAKVDLHAKIPWGDGQTVLREALLMADHNAYHLGQLMMLRKSLGI